MYWQDQEIGNVAANSLLLFSEIGKEGSVLQLGQEFVRGGVIAAVGDVNREVDTLDIRSTTKCVRKTYQIDKNIANHKIFWAFPNLFRNFRVEVSLQIGDIFHIREQQLDFLRGEFVGLFHRCFISLHVRTVNQSKGIH